jgi:hypothetical protein
MLEVAETMLSAGVRFEVSGLKVPWNDRIAFSPQANEMSVLIPLTSGSDIYSTSYRKRTK